jgi:hypothetical protein
MCDVQPPNQLNATMDAQFPADPLQVRAKSAGPQRKKGSNLAIPFAQHNALKNVNVCLR